MQKKTRHFFCKQCFEYWRTDEFHVDDDSGVVMSSCPKCGHFREEVPWYYANLPKMRSIPNGPSTPEAKARVALNGYKHGLYTSHKHLLAPAKKGKYPECETCEFAEQCGIEFKYCPKNIQLITRFIEAYNSGRIESLKEFAGFMQGKAALTLKMLFGDVFTHGTMKEKRVIQSVDEESGETEVVIELQGNPSLKRIPEFFQLLGISAEQQMMTPAKKADDENTKGFISAEQGKQESLDEHIKRRESQLSLIRKNLINAAAARANDSALNDFEKINAEQGDDTDNE